MMTYKALNTFIDDIFAFVIKMPTMYRIGCFRDDIVFFIFLYQRYIYKMDPTRVNEFGVSAEMLEKKDAPVDAVDAEVEAELRAALEAPADTAAGEAEKAAPKPQKPKSKKAKKVD
jgi:hypothetical protein